MCTAPRAEAGFPVRDVRHAPLGGIRWVDFHAPMSGVIAVMEMTENVPDLESQETKTTVNRDKPWQKPSKNRMIVCFGKVVDSLVSL